VSGNIPPLVAFTSEPPLATIHLPGRRCLRLPPDPGAEAGTAKSREGKARQSRSYDSLHGLDLDRPQLRVNLSPDTRPGGPLITRVYTLTQLELTGELLLTDRPHLLPRAH
jgi:hypothetical protein